MSLQNQIKRFIRLADEALRIKESNVSWETKYALIFSYNVAGEIRKTHIDFEWYDPDTSYQEDVVAFVNAVTERANEFKKLLTDTAVVVSET